MTTEFDAANIHRLVSAHIQADANHKAILERIETIKANMRQEFERGLIGLSEADLAAIRHDDLWDYLRRGVENAFWYPRYNAEEAADRAKTAMDNEVMLAEDRAYAERMTEREARAMLKAAELEAAA